MAKPRAPRAVREPDPGPAAPGPRPAPAGAAADPAGPARQLIDGFRHHLRFTRARHWDAATAHDQYWSLATAVRDLIVDRMIATQSAYHERDVKRLCYLSLEYLLGRQLRCNLVNLGLYDAAAAGLAGLGVDLAQLCEIEPDAGLGNGGLGRLAACFMDSLATLEFPAYGYGLRYDFGIFEQAIVDGWQVERPDYWLRFGSPWELARPEFSTMVRLYGRVEERWERDGRFRPTWIDYTTVVAVPFDMPIVGYGCSTVNLLRLWAARASESFDLAAFNRGGYVEAVQRQAEQETISKVLYPHDQHERGRELRLVQQYFFVAATLSDVLRRYERTHDTLDALPDKVAVQLNDTHPALAVAELMRILVDERGLDWDPAWELTVATLGYTNHTLMPEALEKWPVALFGRLLPRHLQIVYEINRRFLDGVAKRWPGDLGRLQRMSLIEEAPVRSVRMANLAIVGSHSVNGVAALHSTLIRRRLVPEFAELWPERFNNKTNGVTPRRWLLACNPRLAATISRRIGAAWVRDLTQLRGLEHFADDGAFQADVAEAKRANKRDLAEFLRRRHGLSVSPQALFDVHVKRLHEYKRQLLNILQVVIRYQRIVAGELTDAVPRVVLFGAKAAPAYARAKLIIKLINDVARTVNHDPRVGDRLRVFFVPNYRVSLAELIIPAADLSEQISTAGTEASGTGNMKFAMNGALTIGTLDGANIEIRDAVGAENFFLFGLTEEEVAAARPHYDPAAIYARNRDARRALDALAAGEFNPAAPELFSPVREWLLRERDPYMLLADLDSYLAAQAEVDHLWQQPGEWTRRAILNIARIGAFSSDRTIREYADDIWSLRPTPVTVRPG